MTIKEAQELIEAWTHKHSTQDNSNLAIITQFTENINELSRKSTKKDVKLSKELSEIAWLTTLLANKYNIDLTSALIDNLEEKNRHDSKNIDNKD